ncbi:MAG: hypothetical protein WEA99_06275 [Brumimicrobium sp.]
MNSKAIIDRIILSLVMIPGKAMPRYYEGVGNYVVCFSAEYIANRYRNTDKKLVKTRLDHEEVFVPCKIISSFLKGTNFREQLKRQMPYLSSHDIGKSYQNFRDMPKGTWFQVHEFETAELLSQLIDSGKLGLSVELKHTIIVNGEQIEIHEEFERMDEPKNILPYTLHIYGGSVWSRGRSEHGKAHLELKKNGKSVDKIFLPYSDIWHRSNRSEKIELLQSEKGNVTRKERKKIAEWLSNGGNLVRCHEEWNESNKDNENRVMFIY